MSKKDYVALAKLLADFREEIGPNGGSSEHIIDSRLIVPLAHMLKADNAQFDYARFLAACGVVAT